jgi:hypothetical protein
MDSKNKPTLIIAKTHLFSSVFSMRNAVQFFKLLTNIKKKRLESSKLIKTKIIIKKCVRNRKIFYLQHCMMFSESSPNHEKKMCRVSARRISIYNFAWVLLKATKKVYLIPQKSKRKFSQKNYVL